MDDARNLEFGIHHGILKGLSVEFLKNCTACGRHLHFYGLSIFPRDLDRNIGSTYMQLEKEIYAGGEVPCQTL